MDPQSVWQAFTGLSLHWRILIVLFVVIVSAELILGRLFPDSRAYRGWKTGVEAVGAVWTGVLLSIVYLIGVGPVSLFMRLGGKDLLDASLGPEPSFWRRHDPNPLGPHQASRHQF